MPVVHADLSEAPELRPNSVAALDLILGPPGEGCFAASPGDPKDNAPRSAIFYPNTGPGREKYLEDSVAWEAMGRNNFLNSAVWSETALDLKRAPLVIGPGIKPLKFWCLWCDLDKGTTEKTKELLIELSKQGCIISTSGGITDQGKKKVHIRVLLDRPITAVEEFYRLNRWFSAAMEADTKFSPVAWLTLPGSTRFKDEYPGGRAETIVRISPAGHPWAFKDLETLFAEYCPEPQGGPSARDASDLVAQEPAGTQLTTEIRRVMRQADPGDGAGRYKQTNKLVKLCAEAGLTKEHALWVLEQHEPSVAKFGPARLALQVHACWPEVVSEELESFGGSKARRVPLSVIGSRDYPDVVWCVPDILAEGLNMLVAPPKAGKSWMVLDIALGCALGGKVFGVLDVTQRPVLYMALEDSHRRLKARSVKLLGHSKLPPEVQVQIECEPNMIIPEILDFLIEQEGKQPLVIVDTLGRARGSGTNNTENAYSADYTFMTTLKNTIDQSPGSTLLLVHHTRKTEGPDPFDSVNGSNGMTGGVDATLLLKRKRQSGEAKLHVTGREVGENAYALTFNDGRWALDGNSLAAAAEDGPEPLSGRMQAILDYVNEVGEDTTPSKVAEALSTTPQSASMYLKRLQEKGLIEKPAYGRYRARG